MVASLFLLILFIFFVLVGHARLQLHDEAQGIIGRQSAEGLRRERVGVPAVGNSVPVRGGCDRVGVPIVGDAVAMRVRANSVGVAGVRDAVSMTPRSSCIVCCCIFL